MRRWLLSTRAAPLLGLLLARGPRLAAAGGANDAVVLVQGAVAVRQASRVSRGAVAPSRWEPYEGSTIGDIAPRILTDDAIEALRKSNERFEEEEPAPESSLTEASAETLAAAVGVGLNRIMARLDTYLTRIMHVKERLLLAVAQAPEGGERLLAFEAAANETLEVAQQGSSTVAVVLRSTVSSTEANLESANHRDLAATMEDSLGSALSQFELMSQSAFLQARDFVVGLSQDAGKAAQRLAGLREALGAHRRQSNALGHAMYKEFQDIVATVCAHAETGNLHPVSVHRVRTAFHTVQESAAAIAWKLYLPAWELATGAGTAAAELGVRPDESAAESADEPFGGEIVQLEVSPLKPTGAVPVTRELDRVEGRVDALLAKSVAAREELQAAVADGLGRSEGQTFEAAVTATLGAVESDWAALGDEIGRTAKSITRCLETAGQHSVGVKLDALLGDALSRSRLLAHALDEPSKLSASLDAFLQQQDALAQSFFRTYHEFMNGMGHSPPGGVPAVSLRRWRASPAQLRGEGSGARAAGQDVEALCAAIGSQAPGPESAPSVDYRGAPALQLSTLDGRNVRRLDTSQQDEDGEVDRRMLRRAQEAAFGSVQQAAAISWKIHSAAWVLVSGVRKATVALIG